VTDNQDGGGLEDSGTASAALAGNRKGGGT
jgi:hypothetical protein